MTSSNHRVEEISLSLIVPNPYQPRYAFNEAAIDELAQSIRESGVLQPVIVRPIEQGYELVAGERRCRASKRAGKSHIPAIVRPMTDEQSMKYALLENVQREDLTPVEEAKAYVQLLESLGMTQAKLSETIGKSRSYIANTVRLLQLPPAVLTLLEEGKLSAGHGRALLSLKTNQQRMAIAQKAIVENWSVRNTEEFVRQYAQRRSIQEKCSDRSNPFLEEMEQTLEDVFGTKVNITPFKQGGTIEIHYTSLDDLDRLIEELSK